MPMIALLNLIPHLLLQSCNSRTRQSRRKKAFPRSSKYSSIYVPIYGPIGRNSEILALPLQGNNNLTVLKGTVESWLLPQSVVQPLLDSRSKYFNTNCLADATILSTSIYSTAVPARAGVLTTESPEREEDGR